MAKENRPEKLGPQRRFASMRAAPVEVDQDARTVTLSFSSETPVPMAFGMEILSHAPGAVRMDRINTSSPLLYNHDWGQLLGVVEKAWIGNDKRGYATVRFGKDDLGTWAMGQVADGILVNVSFMYWVYRFIEDVENDTYTAIDWEPYEISFVTVAADISVGIGRSASAEAREVVIETLPPQQPAITAETEGNDMTLKERKGVLQEGASDGTSGSGGGGAPVVDTNRVAVEGERSRISEIEALCRQHRMPEDIQRGLIQKGATVAEARGTVLDHIQKRTASPSVDMGGGYAPDLTEKEKASYSLCRAINAAVKGDWKLAGFELEVSTDISKRMGRSTSGFFMPTNVQFAMHQRAPLSGGALNTGGALVATNLLPGQFIELLRNQARVLSLGATVISGLVGNIDIPRQIGASTTYWIGDSTSLTESEPTFDKVSMSQKTIGAKGVIYRTALTQATPDVEMILRADLVKQLALGIDAAALYGAGSGGVPLGISNQSGIGSVVGGTNGGTLTIDNLIDLETQVTAANVEDTNLAYLANAKSVGWLKKAKSTTGQYLWSNSPLGQRSGTPGEINGYPVARSNQCRSNLTKGSGTNLSEIYFGLWSELVFAEWGTLEILPNPFAEPYYSQGGIEIRALQSCDINCRHTAAFSAMSDAQLS